MNRRAWPSYPGSSDANAENRPCGNDVCGLKIFQHAPYILIMFLDCIDFIWVHDKSEIMPSTFSPYVHHMFTIFSPWFDLDGDWMGISQLFPHGPWHFPRQTLVQRQQKSQDWHAKSLSTGGRNVQYCYVPINGIRWVYPHPLIATNVMNIIDYHS